MVAVKLTGGSSGSGPVFAFKNVRADLDLELRIEGAVVCRGVAFLVLVLVLVSGAREEVRGTFELVESGGGEIEPVKSTTFRFLVNGGVFTPHRPRPAFTDETGSSVTGETM